MNATWTLSLYPRAWRRRYEPTFRSDLEANDPGLAGTIDLVTGAALAHLRPDPALPDDRTSPAPRPARRDPRDSGLWTVLLAAHASLYTGVIVLLAIINLATNPDTLWFPFAAWGWGIAVATHAGATFSRRSWLPVTALVSAVVAAGLVGINLASGGPAWSIWPVWALFSLVAILALHTSGRIGGFGAHVLVTVLGGLELAGVAIVAPDAAPDLLFTFGYWLAGLLVHALYRFGRPTLLQIHALVFVAFNVLFTIESAVEDTWWSVYPLAGWGIILTIHAIVALAPRRSPAGQWERNMHAVLAAGRASSPHIRRIRRQLHRRGFLAHLALFTAGAATLGVLNLLTPGDTWWMIWPVSVWLVLLAAHLGLLLVPPAPALGAWLAGGGGVIAWLAVLDRATGGATWWYWPAGVWVIGILVVFPLSLDLLRVIDGRAPHGAAKPR